jgi:hypothetical protein
MLYWGVDSSYHRITEEFFAEVAGWGRSLPGMAQRIRSGQIFYRVPAFWGRYLNGGRNSSTEFDPSEKSILARHGCKFLVVYNGRRGIARREGGKYLSLGHSRQDGVAAANAAAVQARDKIRVGMTWGHRIYADLENWRVNPAWLVGWWERLREHGYLAGFYGNPMAWHFVAAEDRGRFRGWRPTTYNRHFRRGIESELERTGEGAEFLFGPGANNIHIWSSQAVTNAPQAMDEPPVAFAPRTRPGLGQSVVWQYKLGTYGGKLDLNLATEAGYQGMWAPSL